MKSLLLFTVLSFMTSPLFAQNSDLRGLKTVVSQLEGETAVVGRQYAVLIAINQYKSWMALQNPVQDAKEIKEILSRKYFITDFMELYDEAATKAGMIRLFNRIINEAKPEDSVLIFYAGHGYLDKTSNTGFWIPVDGGTDVEEQSNWLPNAQIRGFISNMKARHVALIADSCFSGDFLNPTRGIAPAITNQYFKNAYSRISRQVLTSGASESVPDESQFTRQLKLALEGNTSPYLDPLMLYNQIRLGVTQTTPLFGDLKDSGHQEGSSFLLFLKNKAATATEATSSLQESKTTFELAKITANVSILTKTTGTLLLDGVAQGQVPAGRVATIKNLEAGSHELTMQYENGETEKIPLNIDSEEPVSITFASIFLSSTAQSAATVESQAAPSAQAPKRVLPKDSLQDGDPLPKASIKIDGKFDDWYGILPAFTSGIGLPEKKNLAIDKVYLAVDAKNMYMRFDIKDATPSSFFHQSNFMTDNRSRYMIVLMNGARHIEAYVYYGLNDRNPNWNVLIHSWVDGHWVDIDRNGEYAMKGSSLEASFPLEQIRASLGVLAAGSNYTVYARTCYDDAQGRLFEGDRTDSKQLAF